MGGGLTTPDAAAGVALATASGLFNIRPLSIFTGHCNASIARGATIWKPIPSVVDIFFPKVRSRKVSKTSLNIGKRSQRIKRAQLQREGLLPAWVEPPPRPPPREPIPVEPLPPGALAPHLQPILEIARRYLNVEQLADAIRPREYGDIRYRRVQEPAPQPVPPPNQALLPEVIEEPEPIQAPLPDVVQYPRQVRFRQEHQEIAAAAAAPTERSAGVKETEEETEDELQLCHLSSAEGSSDDSSSTDEDRRGFERSIIQLLGQPTTGAKKQGDNAATSTLVLATS
ncbi:hypothetical protein DAPPUDRAFT_242603 [Daphnia pulex]|uniref:Uncharacterized protein n=1 Tax=Daphnia pulex TaxID=6669 RepID=E9GH24_DAPPU|nr:hypothetical protein DAPPUDRAFT_242603 [Daphnia pulex]|eukprot:EFX81266.1 hypothetical protein DAPPUDRAFT_242603 [Daphnia pulex]